MSMCKHISTLFLSQMGKVRSSREYTKLKRIYISMYWRIRYRRIHMGVLDWLSIILYIVISVLITVYISQNLPNLTPPLFELAKICGIIGGLILAGGLSTISSQSLKYEMRRIGALYLAATIAFVVLGLSFPIYILGIKGVSHHIFTAITIASMIVGILSFAFATSWLTLLIPKLLRK